MQPLWGAILERSTLITSGIYLKMIIHECGYPRCSANDRVTVKHAVAFVVTFASAMLLTIARESAEDVVCGVVRLKPTLSP